MARCLVSRNSLSFQPQIQGALRARLSTAAALWGQSQGQGRLVAQPEDEDGENKSGERLVNILLQRFSIDGQIPVSGYAAQGK